MNTLPREKQAAILRAITEGNSIRAAARMANVSKDTVVKLVVSVGEMCELYQDHKLRNLPCKRIEADEIWAFTGAKQKNAGPGQGDCWTYTALDAETKLTVCWLVGQRTQENAITFMKDLASRLANRVQLTTDGHTMYLPAVAEAFHWDVDFAQLIKTYGKDPNAPVGKYSPAICTGAEKTWVMGKPDWSKVSTSYVERANLDLRMRSRRFTRLSNAFSKKIDNHAFAVALHFMVTNFLRPHGTLTKANGGVHTTPAMASGVTDRVWKMEDVLSLLDSDRMIG